VIIATSNYYRVILVISTVLLRIISAMFSREPDTPGIYQYAVMFGIWEVVERGRILAHVHAAGLRQVVVVESIIT
jgi:hypothetical protein